LVNLSGQAYKTIIIPSISVISETALEKLKAFSASGGKVIFMGYLPKLLVGKTFLNAAGTGDINFGMKEPAGQLTRTVLEALPKADLLLDRPCSSIKYLHRSLTDAEIYFIFNESGENQSRTVSMAGKGKAELWNATTGEIKSLAGAVESSTTKFDLSFEPYETKFIIINH